MFVDGVVKTLNLGLWGDSMYLKW